MKIRADDFSIMAIWVVECSSEGNKIRRIFALEST